MSVSIIVFLSLVALIAAVGCIATVRAVVRDGRGKIPVEKSERPWMAGNLPSVPYSVWRP